MAFSDPQSIKIDGVTSSLPRVSTGRLESEYESANGRIDLKASTTVGKRKRHVIRVDVSKVTESAFDTSQNVEVSSSVYLVFDRPLFGYSNEDMKKLFDGFVEKLTATEDKLITQLLGSES